MRLLLECTVPGPPVPWARPRRARGGGSFTDPKDRRHRNAVALVAKAAMREDPATGPVRMSLVLFCKVPESASGTKREQMLRGVLRPTAHDWDNLGKGVSDALSGVAYVDDRQVAEAFVQKLYALEPRTEIKVHTLDIVGP